MSLTLGATIEQTSQKSIYCTVQFATFIYFMGYENKLVKHSLRKLEMSHLTLLNQLPLHHQLEDKPLFTSPAHLQSILWSAGVHEEDIFIEILLLLGCC